MLGPLLYWNITSVKSHPVCIFVSHPPERSAIDCQIDHLHTFNDWGETLQERISQQIQTQWQWRMKLKAPVIVFKSLHQFEAMGLVEANGLTILCLGQKELFLEPCLFYSIPELQQ